MDNDYYKQQLYSLYINCKTTLTDTMQNIIEKINNNITHILTFDDNDQQNNINKNSQNPRCYFSYRKNFPIPLSNGATNDIGWGCMVRTGQMMLCETFQRIEKINNLQKNVMEFFLDTPSALFSIHNITQYGEKNNIPVGSWFTPTGLSITLEDMVNNSIIDTYINVVVARDAVIYKDKINAILDKNKSCLLMIPVMFGINNVNEIYYAQITKFLQHPSSVGFIGGDQKKSIYLISIQDDIIRYLDPHMVKSALINIDPSDQALDLSGLINISNLNSSMLLCFLIKSTDEFNKFINDMNTDVFSFAETYNLNTVHVNVYNDEWLDVS